MTSVQTRLQDAALNANENLRTPRVELAMKSANAPSGRSVDGNLLEANQSVFLVKLKA